TNGAGRSTCAADSTNPTAATAPYPNAGMVASLVIRGSRRGGNTARHAPTPGTPSSRVTTRQATARVTGRGVAVVSPRAPSGRTEARGRSAPQPGSEHASGVAEAILQQRGLLRGAVGAFPERARNLPNPKTLLRRGDGHLAGVELRLPERQVLERLGGERPEPAGRIRDRVSGRPGGQPGEDLHAVRPAEHRLVVLAQDARAVDHVGLAVQDGPHQPSDLQGVV